VAEVERVIAELQREDADLQADVEVLQAGPPIETRQDAPLVRTAQVVARELDLSTELVGYHQASDGRFFAERGTPTILFGPGDPELAHTPNESIDVNEVVTAAKFYALLGLRSLSEGGERG
jgi:succinyl-diaminopimelate desuccinylase